MKFKFDSDLDYQQDAIQSVVKLFDGQKNAQVSFPFVAENGVIPNSLNLSQAKILDNLKAIQQGNNLPLSENLDGMDFSIEMETGTGKTYVYLRTALELNKQYGLTKFIIIVPSVAIREGVIKTLEITKTHFRHLFHNVGYNYYEYDSSKLSRIRQFSRSNGIEILIMTLDSFNKDTNVMNQSRDKLSGQRPIDLVRMTRPILILDEPQNMESEKSKDALSRLDSLFNLRYSATHRNYYNLLYTLTPADAYNKGLVKKIEVSSVIKDGDFNAAYIRCVDIISNERGIKAKLEVHRKLKSGFKKATVTVKNRDNLAIKAKSLTYDGYVVSEINAGYQFIKFENGVMVKLGQDLGGDKKDMMKVQIHQTIEEHFRKAQLLKPYGIKVLSLFFIDKVANYKDPEGSIRTAFTESFKQLQEQFSECKELDVEIVHSGYFSNYKSESGMERDKEAFDLIMKDKERLLSFDEPVQFIFSHSALKEGWDNPNVFNICTLNNTVSNMKKRQEIGRGVRLPVNQNGDRMIELPHNVLTVIANESYSEYVSQLQTEYQEEGIVAPPSPPNARNKTTIKLKKGFELNTDFKELWNRISKRTKYAVDIDTTQFIENCIEEINTITINTIRIKIQKVSLSIKEENGIQTRFIGEAAEDFDKSYSIPNLIEEVAQETALTRTTIFAILSNITNLDLLFKNPQEFISSIILIIKNRLQDFLVNGIKYLDLGEQWEMTLFENIETYKNELIPIKKSIYENLILDSSGERNFAHQLEQDERVKLYIKLPRKFVVKTPIGEYNPDWAVVFTKQDQFGKQQDKLYLVRETKFVEDLGNIRDSEKRKIRCAEEHFNAIKVDFKPITKYEELAN